MVKMDNEFIEQLLSMDLGDEIGLNLKDIKQITLRRTE